MYNIIWEESTEVSPEGSLQTARLGGTDVSAEFALLLEQV
jgi:hypothetical protein